MYILVKAFQVTKIITKQIRVVVLIGSFWFTVCIYNVERIRHKVKRHIFFEKIDIFRTLHKIFYGYMDFVIKFYVNLQSNCKIA